MGQVRHVIVATTHAVKDAIQRSYASLAQLSRELGINPKAVAKWRKRVTVKGLKTGPQEPRSTVLTDSVEAMFLDFDTIRCCRWMIASMLCSRPSRT